MKFYRLNSNSPSNFIKTEEFGRIRLSSITDEQADVLYKNGGQIVALSREGAKRVVGSSLAADQVIPYILNAKMILDVHAFASLNKSKAVQKAAHQRIRQLKST